MLLGCMHLSILLHCCVNDTACGQAMPGCQSLPRALKQGAARCADFVLLNKTDMLAERQLDSLSAIVTSLNPLAKACLLAACHPPVCQRVAMPRPCMAQVQRVLHAALAFACLL